MSRRRFGTGVDDLRKGFNERANPDQSWDNVDDVYLREVPLAVTWLHAAGVGFVLVAGRHAHVDGVAVALLLAQLPALALARRWPRLGLALSVVLQLVLYARGNGPNVGIGAVIQCIVRLHKHQARRTADAGRPPTPNGMIVLVGLGVMAVIGFVPWLFEWSSTALLSGPAGARNPLTIFVVLAIIQTIASRGAEARSIFRSARQRVADADAARDQAVVDERARIARELHDVVAHQMSVVVAQAQGAEALVDRDPHQVRRALSTISTTTRDALVELRRLVGVGRDSDSDPPGYDPAVPQPGVSLDDLSRLAATAEAAGLEVSMTIELATEDAVPVGIALSVYRTIQEALTNAAKHSPGSDVSVEIRQEASAVRVEVTNGPAKRRPADFPNSGVGLVGMRERATLFGGDLEVGPLDTGGWSVRAAFPNPTDE